MYIEADMMNKVHLVEFLQKMGFVAERTLIGTNGDRQGHVEVTETGFSF